MSFPRISLKSRHKAVSGRLGSQFLKRLEKGALLDRRAYPVGKQETTATKAPRNLFLTIKEEAS